MNYYQARIQALENEINRLRDELSYLHTLYQKLLDE